MASSKQNLTESLAPAESTGRFFDVVCRCLLTAMFALAFWSLVLLTDIGSCTFVTFAFAGSFVINLSLRGNKRWELPVAIVAGSAYALGYVKYGGPMASIPGSTLGIIGAFLGIGSMVVKSGRGIWETSPAAIKSNRENLIELGSVPLLCILSGVGVSLAARSLTMTYDSYLYAFDSSLGFSPGFVTGQFFRSHYWIAYCSALAYNYLPIGLVSLRALQLRESKPGIDLRLIYAALGAIGFCLYVICPGIGPINRFPGFPYSPPVNLALEAVPAGPLLPRNAMPSLHVGWAVLVFVNSWSQSRPRWVALCAAVFLCLTALATLGSGEHHLIDLIVVMPLTLAIQAGFQASGSLQRWAVLTGTILTLAWLVALRTGVLVNPPISPKLSSFLVLATLAISIALHVKVARDIKPLAFKIDQ